MGRGGREREEGRLVFYAFIRPEISELIDKSTFPTDYLSENNSGAVQRGGGRGPQ